MSDDLHGKKILVVDDEAHIRNIMCRTLKLEGCDVTGASSGQEALEKAALEKFDLILTDIRMPGMNGLELLQRIKAEYPDIKAVMLTGVSDVEATQAAATERGAFACMVKPASLDDVLETITLALESSMDNSGVSI